MEMWNMVQVHYSNGCDRVSRRHCSLSVLCTEVLSFQQHARDDDGTLTVRIGTRT